MAPDRAATVLEKMGPERAGPIVEQQQPEVAANLLRRMEVTTREALLSAVADGPAKPLRRLLHSTEGTAGALMDPNVLALPRDLSAEEALAHIRASPEHARFNLYVVDREQVLVGVLNLRELLLARRQDLLSAIAHSAVLSLPARADRHAILSHPVWRQARSVPVVDEQGVYLGAVRYPTLRRLEEELREDASEGPSTAEILGDLYSTGIVSVFGALATSVARPLPWSES
jgi:magnesium transporter